MKNLNGLGPIWFLNAYFKPYLALFRSLKGSWMEKKKVRMQIPLLGLNSRSIYVAKICLWSIGGAKNRFTVDFLGVTLIERYISGSSKVLTAKSRTETHFRQTYPATFANSSSATKCDAQTDVILSRFSLLIDDTGPNCFHFFLWNTSAVKIYRRNYIYIRSPKHSKQPTKFIAWWRHYGHQPRLNILSQLSFLPRFATQVRQNDINIGLARKKTAL